MLTQEKEGGRTKCCRYWPSTSAPETFAGPRGTVTLELVATTEHADYVERLVSVKMGDVAWTVTHLQFTRVRPLPPTPTP